MNLKPKQFRILNYRNFEDSGWIPLDRVTAFLGCNESGKTALLKALHKFNPAHDLPYDAHVEFPRERHEDDKTREGQPVCKVQFELAENFRERLKETIVDCPDLSSVTCTRYYNGELDIEYDAEISDGVVSPAGLISALENFYNHVSGVQVRDFEEIRADTLLWIDRNKEGIAGLDDLRSAQGVEMLGRMNQEMEQILQHHDRELTSESATTLLSAIGETLQRSQAKTLRDQLDEEVEKNLPVFIYFEDYDILNSAVDLSQFLGSSGKTLDDSQGRIINAMFKCANLSIHDIHELGVKKRNSTAASEKRRKDRRNSMLNAASTEVSKKFNEWYKRRKHRIHYRADGHHFHIWVSDDRLQDVEIELESRSKGFQWFFSFYLIFSAESEEGHKDAVLLLDEPGLHLHPVAQQELIAFFESLADKNPIIYTTHSPFMIDGDHYDRVRPVVEDRKSGHSRVSADGWPEDAETIFPLHAAVGYKIIEEVFYRNKKTVLVEGYTDLLYLRALSLHCRVKGLASLSDDVLIVPCDGSQGVKNTASLFHAKGSHPVILLDGDKSGTARRDSLIADVYAKSENDILLLSDVLVDIDGCAIEDLIGEEVILPMARKALGADNLQLGEEDRKKENLAGQIKSAAERLGIKLPKGWKVKVAHEVTAGWREKGSEEISQTVLERADKLFRALNDRFRATGNR